MRLSRQFWQRCRRGVALTILCGSVGLSTPPLVVAFALIGTEKRAATAEQSVDQSPQLPSFAGIAKTAMPAVVNIASTYKEKPRRRRPPAPFPMPQPGPFGEDDPFAEFFRHFFGDRPPPSVQQSLGSGFIISPDGYILTNHHVVGEASQITVRLSDKEEYKAKVIGTDDKTDLALIKIIVKRPLPTVPLGHSAELQVGDWVIAIGNPFGLEQTVTAGIVSAKGRVIGEGPYDDFIQTDASINPGNSGGPLLNLQGEVVGINSAIFSQSGGNIGIGFAIPIDLAKPVVSQLQTTGTVRRGWLGVTIQAVTPELAKSFGLTEPTGALVTEVSKGSPADKAGVERGDIIRTFAGTTIKDSHDLPAVVAQTPIGKHVEVTLLRRGTEKTVTITVGDLRQQAEAEGTENIAADWGVTVTDLTPDVREAFRLAPTQVGVVITEIASGSPAERAGLQQGDVIEEINRHPVRALADFSKHVTEANGQPTLLLLIRREEQSMFFVLSRRG